MGGFLLPFLTELGRLDVPFDFRLPGVTSMSADVHKYGYASKGVSVILYRTHELARKQLFVTTDWLGGFYASTAMAGTRPAGPVAAAWAALMHIGHRAISSSPGRPTTRHASCGRASRPSTGSGCGANRPPRSWRSAPVDPEAIDIFAVGERLAEQGWYLDRQNRPDSLHATVHAGSAATVPDAGDRPGPGRSGRWGRRAPSSATPPTARASNRAPSPTRPRSTRSSPHRAGTTGPGDVPTRGSAWWRVGWATSHSN